MGHRRRVVLGAQFVERAQELFPPGGSPDGLPSYELFSETVLPAVRFAFEHDFAGQQADDPESPIRFVHTAKAPYFPVPLAFYALLADEDTVALIDVIVDEDWYGTFDDADNW